MYTVMDACNYYEVSQSVRLSVSYIAAEDCKVEEWCPIVTDQVLKGSQRLAQSPAHTENHHHPLLM